jgi:predicted phosphoadenosine phosphosulfate sulfurtransferase
VGRYKPKKKPVPRGTAGTKPIIEGPARPKYVIEGWNVFDAALARMRWIFDEFDNKVSVSNSGGKDSTVVLELASIVNNERGLPPLHVVWLDQECEYASTVEYQRHLLYERDDIDFTWYQIPFRLYNATNHENPWLNVWGEGEEWVRDKEPGTIHVNDLKMRNGKTPDRFKDVLARINVRTGGAILTGMRAEESPSRRIFMTSSPMYKWVTWGSEGWLDDETRSEPTYQMFHPIYDWSYRDVWKAINEHGWRYNKMYDVQFRYGIPIRQMRVSNYHHVEALGSLKYLQEAEPETWEAATRRLQGINAYGHVGTQRVPDLPYMFADWEEYLGHLIGNLIEPENQHHYVRMWNQYTNAFPDLDRQLIAQRMVGAVIRNDFIGVSLQGWVHQQRGKIKRAREKEARAS